MNSNTFKHTPGPWHINTLEVVPFSIHAHRGVVAEVSRGTMNEVKADEIEANARLISAAPDLLAALQQIVKLAHRGDNDNRPIDSGAICHTAWDALAKARGEKAS